MASALSWLPPFINSRAVVAIASGDDASSAAFNADVESRGDAAAASARPMHPVEELFQVKVDHNGEARVDVLLRMLHRLMGRASGAGSPFPSDPARDDVLALRSSFTASGADGRTCTSELLVVLGAQKKAATEAAAPQQVRSVATLRGGRRTRRPCDRPFHGSRRTRPWPRSGYCCRPPHGDCPTMPRLRLRPPRRWSRPHRRPRYPSRHWRCCRTGPSSSTVPFRRARRSNSWSRHQP